MNILDLLDKKDKLELNIKEFTIGQSIFKEGEECLSVGVILAGKVKISTFSTSGKEIIFNIIDKDEIFGNNLIFSSTPFYKGTVFVMEACRIAFINKQHLTKILKTNDAFFREYLRIQSDFGKYENFKIKLLSIPRVEERLIFFLENKNNAYEYLSITSLADELGVQRESLSRAISKLVKAKIINHRGKTLSLTKK